MGYLKQKTLLKLPTGRTKSGTTINKPPIVFVQKSAKEVEANRSSAYDYTY